MTRTAKLYHIAVFGFYCFVLYRINNNNSIELPPDQKVLRNIIKFRTRYLTNWTYLLQFSYYAICIASHFLNLFSGLRNVKSKLDKFSNFVFTAIATPMAIMVTVVFWIIYAIDRELIFPKIVDLIMPAWINHSIHTLNTLFALGDMYLVNHKYPSWKHVAQGILAYLIPYGVCLFGTYWQMGFWLYPFFSHLTWTMRVIFGVLTYIGALLCFGITKYISFAIWGTSHSERAKKNNKNKYKK